jgi:hypothetical protein
MGGGIASPTKQLIHWPQNTNPSDSTSRHNLFLFFNNTCIAKIEETQFFSLR